MTPMNNRKELHSVIAVVATLIVIVLILTAGLMRLAHSLAPQIGDIIAFPATKIASISTASFEADPGGISPRRPCVLNVQVMQSLGGSLLIEAVQIKPDFRFRVHWAGVRTSNSEEDCGSSADLLLSNAQLGSLIFAAGGRGVKVGDQ